MDTRNDRIRSTDNGSRDPEERSSDLAMLACAPLPMAAPRPRPSCPDGEPCGLLGTPEERLINAMKHAFPNDASGEIVVGLRRVGDQAELQVRDNGVGVPEGLDLSGVRSLGLRTVSLLARGLGATVRVESEAGACFTITFPVTPP